MVDRGGASPDDSPNDPPKGVVKAKSIGSPFCQTMFMEVVATLLCG